MTDFFEATLCRPTWERAGLFWTPRHSLSRLRRDLWDGQKPSVHFRFLGGRSSPRGTEQAQGSVWLWRALSAQALTPPGCALVRAEGSVFLVYTCTPSSRTMPASY